MIELWGGFECTVNRVREGWFDQLARTGHDRRLADLERVAALGIRTLRYPVLWEHVAPDSLDTPDWTAADARLARLRALGVRPIAGLLHHGSGPRYTSLLDPRFPSLLARFARSVAERYPWITDFTPVNEPLTTARFSGLYGLWYPHLSDDVAFVRALLHQLRGTVKAMRAIRAVTPQARLIQTEDCGRTFGTPATAAQVAFDNARRWLTFDLLAGRVDRAHPLWGYLTASGAAPAELEAFVDSPCPADVVGLNYYVTSDRFLDERLERYPAVFHGGSRALAYADVEAVRVRPEGIVGHAAHLMDAWERYRRPVAITESHLACTPDQQVCWLLESWNGAVAARDSGADVRAVTAWALLGSYDWDSLVTRDAGHYEPGAFDVRWSPPRATAVARALARLSNGHPSVAGAGAMKPWWRQAERLFYESPTTAAAYEADDRRGAA